MNEGAEKSIAASVAFQFLQTKPTWTSQYNFEIGWLAQGCFDLVSGKLFVWHGGLWTSGSFQRSYETWSQHCEKESTFSCFPWRNGSYIGQKQQNFLVQNYSLFLGGSLFSKWLNISKLLMVGESQKGSSTHTNLLQMCFLKRRWRVLGSFSDVHLRHTLFHSEDNWQCFLAVVLVVCFALSMILNVRKE